MKIVHIGDLLGCSRDSMPHLLPPGMSLIRAEAMAEVAKGRVES